MPLAGPPIDGLHGIMATLLISSVNRAVLAPIFAAANAASIPACPPPTTIISYMTSLPLNALVFYHIALIFQ